MEGKNSFIIYCDLLPMVEKMPSEDAGNLFKLILEYTNDKDPDESKYGLLVEVAFQQIKQILKRDLNKWKETKEGKSIGGRMGNLKRYHLDLYNQVVKKIRTLEEAEQLALSRKTSHSEDKKSLPIASVAVNDSVSVNGNILKGEFDFLKPYIVSVCKYFNVDEVKNFRTFAAFTNFIESLHKTNRLEYFKSQFAAYQKITTKEGWKHSPENFMGKLKENYDNGAWCQKTYTEETPTKNESSNKRMADIILGRVSND